MGLTEPDFSETSDRFYLLKKDSQRRAFVVRVLKVDKSLIIDSWHRIIAKPDSLTKVIYFCFHLFFNSLINRSSRRKNDMASNPFFHKSLPTGQTFFPTFPKEFSNFLQTKGAMPLSLIDLLLSEFGIKFGKV